MAFQIDRGNFDPAQESVDLAGTFNGWGTDPLTVLSDADGDSSYGVTLDGFTPGEEIEFKFRLNGVWDGREEFPGVGSNRRYTVQVGENHILVWYGDRPPDLGVGELSWWNDRVFYEIFVRSFYDSDGDGIGDFPGLTQKLDYLNDGDPATTDDLGITGIWLMPIHPSPSYHGYDAVDYRSVHPDYGTMAEFETFVVAAHARGIRVIIDLVLNHASSQHPWFLASASGDPQYRDWFRWSPTVLDDSGPWGQPVWHDHGSEYYYGLFWSGMPDLNYDDPDVKTEMFDIAGFWLEDVGVDGFRLDAVLYIDEDEGQLKNTPETFDFWNEFNAHVKSIRSDGLSVGEAWTSSATVNQYVVGDRLDFCFEFDLAGTIVGGVNSGVASGIALEADQVFDLYPYGQFGTFLSNHDQNRVMDTFAGNEGKVRAAAGIYLTLPGVPFLYYGEEIGQLGTKPDPDIRRPMQWTGGDEAGFTTGTPWHPPSGNQDQYNVESETQDPASLLSWYRSLIRARSKNTALRRGDFAALGSSHSAVTAYLRRYEQETVLCLANVSELSAMDVTLTGSASTLTVGAWELEDLLNDGATTLDVTAGHEIEGVDLEPYEVRVLRSRAVTGIGSGGGEGTDDRRSSIFLRASVPNPFDSATTVRYALREPGHVRLSVYDLAGRLVVILRDGVQSAGSYEVPWRGRDTRDRRIGNGVYFLRLEAAGEVRVQKVLVRR